MLLISDFKCFINHGCHILLPLVGSAGQQIDLMVQKIYIKPGQYVPPCVPGCLWTLSRGYSKSPLIIRARDIGWCVRWVIQVIFYIARLPSPSLSPPHEPMRGYQRRPCLCTPAPGGSDRYSLSMTAGPFCIRKAILIHEPINTHTSGFASAAPPPLFRSLFSCVSVSLSALWENQL